MQPRHLEFNAALAALEQVHRAGGLGLVEFRQQRRQLILALIAASAGGTGPTLQPQAMPAFPDDAASPPSRTGLWLLLGSTLVALLLLLLLR